MIPTSRRHLGARHACALIVLLGLSCNREDSVASLLEDGPVKAAPSALFSTEGLLVHLTPGSIASGGTTWPDADGRPVTFTAGPGSAAPQLVADVIGDHDGLRFSGAQYMTASLGDTADWQGYTIIAVLKTRTSFPSWGA